MVDDTKAKHQIDDIYLCDTCGHGKLIHGGPQRFQDGSLPLGPNDKCHVDNCDCPKFTLSEKSKCEQLRNEWLRLKQEMSPQVQDLNETGGRINVRHIAPEDMKRKAVVEQEIKDNCGRDTFNPAELHELGIL